MSEVEKFSRERAMANRAENDYGRTKIDDHAKAFVSKVYRFFRGLFALIGIAFVLFVIAIVAIGIHIVT